MRTSRIVSRLGMCTALLVLSASAAAQDNHDQQSSFYGFANRNAPYSNPAPQHAPIQPFNPVGFTHKVQPFGPADISDYGNGPPRRTGFFGSYERLYWSINKPATDTIGSENAEAFFIQNGLPVFVENSFTTDFLKSTSTFGNRWEIGYMDSNEYGWLVSGIDHLSQNQTCQLIGATVLFDDPFGYLLGFVDEDNDGFDDDLNLNLIFGRDGEDTSIPPDGIPDTPAPTDGGDTRPIIPKFDLLIASSHAEVNSWEVMRMYRAPRLHGGGQFELLYGVRYFRLDDWFILNGIGGSLADTFIETKFQNNVIGPQIGGRYSHQRGRWVFSVEGRFSPGLNFQNMRQKSEIATQASALPTGNDDSGGLDLVRNAPVNLQRTSAKDVVNDEQFSPIAELRLQTTYIVTRSVALKLGYTLLAGGGFTRASNRINYELPSMGITDSPRGEDLFINGLNFGVEINR